jgi:chemotaxis protein methyltransferase CheR
VSALTGNRVDAETVITEADFRRFGEFMYRVTGIFFGDNKRYFVDKRLLDRIAATRSGNFAAYFALLRADRRELEQLINLLTVNETYFYREEHQFACLVRALLPELVRGRRRGDRLRLWSMPCSTGEEPYSIAIYLLETWALVDDYEIEILGADIDTRALAVAASGVYDDRALHRLSPELRRRYFEPAANGRHRLIDSLRQSVSFTRVNVNDPAQLAQYRDIDVIFCRNMLIYFDDASRRRTAEGLHDCLRPGGFICLGHSESMSRISPIFAVRRFADAVVYQKAATP